MDTGRMDSTGSSAAKSARPVSSSPAGVRNALNTAVSATVTKTFRMNAVSAMYQVWPMNGTGAVDEETLTSSICER
jgi:hypothetical protein